VGAMPTAGPRKSRFSPGSTSAWVTPCVNLASRIASLPPYHQKAKTGAPDDRLLFSFDHND